MKKILITINDELLSSVYSGLFQEKGFQVLSAQNESDFLNVIYDKLPDIVLIDVDIAERDNYSLMEKIKLDNKINEIPIIFISKVKEEGYKQKAIDFEVKDFVVALNNSPIDVFAKIKTHLSSEKTYKIKIHEESDVIKNLANDLGYDSLMCKKCGNLMSLYLIRDLSKGLNYFKISFVCTDC
jgi:PleD family two-component response regulator